MRIRFYFFAFILLTQINPAQSQSKRTNMWYFGYYTGIDFNTGVPTVITNSAMGAYEGCSSICDNNGNILFYTHGMTIYNRMNTAMPNGSGLLGGFSCSQAALAFPAPGSTTQYYVFALAEMADTNGLSYSIVDMTLDGGKGDVTLKNVNVLNSIPLTEKLAGTMHANGQDVWIAVHENMSDTYYAYLVTSAGINPPVVTHIGSMHYGPDPWTGCMKFSPSGNKLATAVYGVSKVDLLDFDNATGVFSNAATFTPPGAYYPYGVEFSPGGTKLYATGSIFSGTDLYQFDLNAGSNAAIMASAVSVDFYPSFLYAIQSAPDGKIYVSHHSDYWIGTINFPEVAGVGCNVVDSTLYLGPVGFCNLGLPNYISNYLSVTTGLNDATGSLIAAGVSPNPFFNELHVFVKDAQPAEIIIYDSISKEVIRQKFTHSATINTAVLAKGLYIYEIRNRDRLIEKGKIIKE